MMIQESQETRFKGLIRINERRTNIGGYYHVYIRKYFMGIRYKRSIESFKEDVYKKFSVSGMKKSYERV